MFSTVNSGKFDTLNRHKSLLLRNSFVVSRRFLLETTAFGSLTLIFIQSCNKKSYCNFYLIYCNFKIYNSNMKFNTEKKNSIISYILEKISEGSDSPASHVSGVFGINKSTVYRYLNELTAQGLIEKTGHDSYRLVNKEWNYKLSCPGSDLVSDTDLYTNYLLPHLSGFSANVIGIWSYALSEMTNNILDHSKASEVQMSIIQNSLQTSVILKDNGVGIFQKIKDHFHFPSIDDAISELFKGKLTTDEINHSGEGIFFTSRLMDSFYIISSGKIFSCNKFDAEKILNSTSDDESGTCVIMSLSNQSKKELKEIFDAYADIDGGFTKTSIPLKNMFDVSPVSRSQAKRLCERLDRFNEVILDFEGLTSMGQGFAHQVFVVYKNQHPEVDLKPVNMNDTIRKMYYHVTNS